MMSPAPSTLTADDQEILAALVGLVDEIDDLPPLTDASSSVPTTTAAPAVFVASTSQQTPPATPSPPRSPTAVSPSLLAKPASPAVQPDAVAAPAALATTAATTAAVAVAVPSQLTPPHALASSADPPTQPTAPALPATPPTHQEKRKKIAPAPVQQVLPPAPVAPAAPADHTEKLTKTLAEIRSCSVIAADQFYSVMNGRLPCRMKALPKPFTDGELLTYAETRLREEKATALALARDAQRDAGAPPPQKKAKKEVIPIVASYHTARFNWCYINQANDFRMSDREKIEFHLRYGASVPELTKYLTGKRGKAKNGAKKQTKAKA